MKYWRALLWLLPASTGIPLSYFVYQLLTTDFSAYFGDVKLAGLIVVLGVPNLIILVIGIAAAVFAWRGQELVALIVAAAVCALQLTTAAWSSGELFDAHTRLWFLLVFAVPGTVAGALGLSGWLLLRASNRTVAIVSGVLLLVPVAASGVAIVQDAVEVARECPAGPPVDLTFTGLESGHFTTSCGLPNGISTLAGCTQSDATVGLFDGQFWYLDFPRADRPVASTDQPYLSPRLYAGQNTTYGLGPNAWSGSYAYDAGKRCSGSVDAYLYPTGRGPEAGSVHVVGHFAAPD